MPHFVFIQVAIACDGSILCSEAMYISPLGDFSFDALASLVPPKGGDMQFCDFTLFTGLPHLDLDWYNSSARAG